VNKAFTRRAVEDVRPTIETVVSSLIEGFAGREVIDVIDDFAAPLPVLVIARMIGADAADAQRLKAWSDDAAALMLGSLEDRARHDRAARGIGEMASYFRALVVERRAKPGSDLVSSLIAAQERGETLSEEELIAMCVLLMFAGHETTTNLIANGVLALLDHPDQLANARPMTPAGVEEVLRFDGPMKATTRTATAPTEVAGTRVEPGQRVLFSLFAANRDPARFPQPDVFDLTRKDNPHLGFGYATHYCTGAPLARTEGLIALTALMRLSGMDLAVPRSELDWHPSLLGRTLKRLPVRVRAS
jgi:cytochrome P450